MCKHHSPQQLSKYHSLLKEVHLCRVVGGEGLGLGWVIDCKYYNSQQQGIWVGIRDGKVSQPLEGSSVSGDIKQCKYQSSMDGGNRLYNFTVLSSDFCGWK